MAKVWTHSFKTYYNKFMLDGMSHLCVENLASYKQNLKSKVGKSNNIISYSLQLKYMKIQPESGSKYLRTY